MKRRERILRNYEGRCHICGHLIDGEFDLDHVVPRARGGTDKIGNLAPAHPSCNRSKQAVVSHTPASTQYSMFGERRTQKETHIRPSAVHDLEHECREWILRQVDTEPDSGMPTRFHHWLVDRLRQKLGYTETQQRFVDLCKKLKVRAVVRGDTFVFVHTSKEFSATNDEL